MSDEDERNPQDPRSPDRKPTTGFAAYLVVFFLIVRTFSSLTDSLALFHLRRHTEHHTLCSRYCMSTGVRHRLAYP
jgi:hypothetical protein